RTEPQERLRCLSDLASSSGDLHRWVSQFCQWMSASADQSTGLPHARMMPLSKRLAMTEQISQMIRVLARAGNQFRRMEARALYAEGLTMAQLATVLGVSRQRVSALLREGGAGTATEGRPESGPVVTGEPRRGAGLGSKQDPGGTR